MRLPATNYDSDTVALMGSVCDDAWREIQQVIFFPTVEDAREFRSELALRVMAAVAGGVRDRAQLRTIALDALDG
jgi:hypothetical protein